MRRPGLLLLPVLAALTLLASACSGGETAKVAAAAPESTASSNAAARCKYRAGWQKLANKIDAPVYCPGWLPDPLTSELGGRWNNINSVDKDRSYLMSFVWQETGGGA